MYLLHRHTLITSVYCGLGLTTWTHKEQRVTCVSYMSVVVTLHTQVYVSLRRRQANRWRSIDYSPAGTKAG